jgi:hypothetical protein
VIGRSRAWRTVAWALPAWAGAHGVAHACAVCFGPAGEPMIDGTKAAIVFMLALTYLLLGGGVGLAMLLHRSRRKALETSPTSPTEASGRA